VRLGWSGVGLQALACRRADRNDQCGNQHHSHELLMMGIVMPEIC